MDYSDWNINNEGFKRKEDLKSWEKSYWYLRYFIDTNRFGALSKDKKRISNIYNNLLSTYKLLHTGNHKTIEKKEILSTVFFDTITDGLKEESKKNVTTLLLYNHLQTYLTEPRDYFILAITLKEFLLPTNVAIEQVPTIEGTDFARKYGKALLDIKKEEGLSTIIRDWDNFTESLCLNKERDLIVELVSTIRDSLKGQLKEYFENIDEKDSDIILSAICQEYERRVGQKRKQRAGNDLESVTDFILNYFNFKTAGAPEHFTTGLEVDNWVKDKDGWYIGISLKRTLRERWKQTYTTEIGLMDRNKIKYIIHIINNDFDLSPSKITELGSYRHLFFIGDNSSVLKELKSHVAMGKYLFPMTELIKKLKEMTGME